MQIYSVTTMLSSENRYSLRYEAAYQPVLHIRWGCLKSSWWRLVMVRPLVKAPFAIFARHVLASEFIVHAISAMASLLLCDIIMTFTFAIDHISS